MSHTRQVVFVKPDYWIVIDTMQPSDEKQHRYETLFHLDAEHVTVDPESKSVTAVYGDQEFRIVPVGSGEIDVRIAKGETKPVVQGWMPTGRHNHLRPIPTAVFSATGTGPTVRAWLLMGRERTQAWPVASVQLHPTGSPSDIAVDFVRAEGLREMLVRRSCAGSRAEFGPVATDAEFLLMRVRGAKVEETFRIGGTKEGAK